MDAERGAEWLPGTYKPHHGTETKAGEIGHARYKSLLNECPCLVETGGGWLEVSYGIAILNPFSL
jgi:hypothetical protein